MEVKLGIGIGEIKFGMKQEDVKLIFGNPDKVQIDDDFEDREPMHQFNNINSRITYYSKEDLKLGYIRSSNKELTFQSSKLIDSSISELANFFKNLKFEEEEFDFWVDHFNEENWLLIRSEYGKIKEIELGVPFIQNSDEEYNWPSK